MPWREVIVLMSAMCGYAEQATFIYAPILSTRLWRERKWDIERKGANDQNGILAQIADEIDYTKRFFSTHKYLLATLSKKQEQQRCVANYLKCYDKAIKSGLDFAEIFTSK